MGMHWDADCWVLGLFLAANRDTLWVYAEYIVVVSIIIHLIVALASSLFSTNLWEIDL